MLSYDEEVDKLLNIFDDYSLSSNNSNFKFEAYKDISDYNFSGI